MLNRYLNLVLTSCLLFSAAGAHAGAQKEEQIEISVKTLMKKSIGEPYQPKLILVSDGEARAWLSEMSKRLEKYMPNKTERENFLTTVYYEATRAALDPQLVLGLIQVESGFKKYAISDVGARGFMQVMPFWPKLFDRDTDNLFEQQTNLRYGCNILKHYLDMENGVLFMALGRYNGSRGLPEYPNMVVGAWHRNWNYEQ